MSVRRLQKMLAAVEPLIRADERERIAKLADEVGAKYWAHEGAQGTYHPFADLIREEEPT